LAAVGSAQQKHSLITMYSDAFAAIALPYNAFDKLFDEKFSETFTLSRLTVRVGASPKSWWHAITEGGAAAFRRCRRDPVWQLFRLHAKRAEETAVEPVRTSESDLGLLKQTWSRAATDSPRVEGHLLNEKLMAREAKEIGPVPSLPHCKATKLDPDHLATFPAGTNRRCRNFALMTPHDGRWCCQTSSNRGTLL
jgi:hypothetical protein